MKGERRPGAQPCYYCLLIKYQCEKLDVLADEVVAKVLHDDVAVTSLDTLVVDTDHHGGVGLLDAAAGRSFPSSQALTGDASDGDELPVPNFNAARRNGATEPGSENLVLLGFQLAVIVSVSLVPCFLTCFALSRSAVTALSRALTKREIIFGLCEYEFLGPPFL